MLKAHVRVCWNDNGDHVLAPIHVMERLRARRTASCRAMSSHEFPHSGWESRTAKDVGAWRRGSRPGKHDGRERSHRFLTIFINRRRPLTIFRNLRLFLDARS